VKSLEDTIKAGEIALAVIMTGMVAIDRIPGIIACITLVTFTWLLLLLFVLLNVTLTLPWCCSFCARYRYGSGYEYYYK
jgi:preprotein translocase subunit SecD